MQKSVRWSCPRQAHGTVRETACREGHLQSKAQPPSGEEQSRVVLEEAGQSAKAPSRAGCPSGNEERLLLADKELSTGDSPGPKKLGFRQEVWKCNERLIR